MSVLKTLFGPFTSQDPSSVLIRKTAKRQWKILALTIFTSLFEAFSEGITLGLVFLSIEVISSPSSKAFDWSSLKFIDAFPYISDFLNGIQNTYVFLFLLLFALVTQALQSLSRYLNMVSIGFFSARVRSIITAKIHDQILAFSFPYASSYKIGDLLDYASSGSDAIRLYIDQSSGLFVLVCLLFTYLVVLLAISPWLLLAAFCVGICLGVVQKKLLPSIRSGSESVTSEQVLVSTAITENFQGLRLLHSNGMLDIASSKIRSRLITLESSMRSQVVRLSIITPLTTFLPVFAIVSIASLSLVFLGSKSSGILPSLVTFVLALQRLTIRFGMAANIVSSLADNSGRMGRLDRILSPIGKQFRPTNGVPFINLSTAISFNSVSMKYSSDGNPALNNVSFILPRGKSLALVGSSGAGKSTIADLLTGLYIPTSGEILIDDLPLLNYNLSSWQQHLGIVSQDTFLFNTSILENVSFGSPKATFLSVKDACRAAQADEFIESLPSGYDTIIGERGYTLSGGQRQRISLARAILRHPALLILDEATSALDSQNELLVQDALAQLDSSITILTIAHRLSTIVRADNILVLDKGLVAEQGTHQDLLSLNGVYSRLWNLQSK